MKTLITNAHIISPDLEIKGGSILIEGSRIINVFHPNDPLPTIEQIDIIDDVKGNYAFPGFIDIHSHGADGKDISDSSPESIRHIARKKLQEGVTTWLPTTLTQSPQKLTETFQRCATYIENQEYAKVPGIHLEGPYLNPSKAGAQDPQHFRKADIDELRHLNSIAPIILCSLAPCQPQSSDFIKQATELGIATSAAHTTANTDQIKTAKAAGLRHLTHFGNAMSALHHRDIGTVGTGLLDDDLLLEFIPDTIHLSPDFLELLFKIKPIHKLILITDSMAGSWVGNGNCVLGDLPVTVKDNIAKIKNSETLAGSTLRYNHGLKNIKRITSLPLTDLIKTTSLNQALSLGLKNLGHIKTNFIADITIQDKEFNTIQTYLNGKQTT